MTTPTLNDAAMAAAGAVVDTDTVQEYCSNIARAKLNLLNDADVTDNDDYWREYSIALDEVIQEARKRLLPHPNNKP